MYVLLLNLINKIKNSTVNGKVSFKMILSHFQSNEVLTIMMIMMMFMVIPLPFPPGLTTLISIPIFVLSYKFIFGKKTFSMPYYINQYKINSTILILLLSKLSLIIKFLDKYSKPRMTFYQNYIFQKFLGILLMIISLLIMIPVPFTSALPALSGVIIIYGLLSKDGLIIILGTLLVLFSILISGLVMISSVNFLKFIMYFFLKKVIVFF